MIKIEFSTTYIYNTTYLWKMLMPPLPCPKHHVCPQTLSSFGWCLLAPLAASWPLFCCKLVVLISWPQLTASSHHQQSSLLSSNNKNHTKVQFLHDRKWTKINAIPLKRRKGGDEFYEGIYVLYDHHPLSHLLVLKSLIWKISHFWYCFSIF